MNKMDIECSKAYLVVVLIYEVALEKQRGDCIQAKLMTSFFAIVFVRDLFPSPDPRLSKG